MHDKAESRKDLKRKGTELHRESQSAKEKRRQAMYAIEWRFIGCNDKQRHSRALNRCGIWIANQGNGIDRK